MMCVCSVGITTDCAADVLRVYTWDPAKNGEGSEWGTVFAGVLAA